MLDLIEGKTVAIVGNSVELFESSFGDEIDSFEVVCRLNRGAEIIDSQKQGTKITIWGYGDFDIVRSIFDSIHCDNTIHLSENRQSHKISKKTKHYMDLSELSELKKELLWNFPSSGLMMLYYIINRNARLVSLFGFDFNRSPSWPNNNWENNVKNTHNWELERGLVTELQKNSNIEIKK